MYRNCPVICNNENDQEWCFHKKSTIHFKPIFHSTGDNQNDPLAIVFCFLFLFFKLKTIFKTCYQSGPFNWALWLLLGVGDALISLINLGLS